MLPLSSRDISMAEHCAEPSYDLTLPLLQACWNSTAGVACMCIRLSMVVLGCTR